jgi:hypothetical protein
MCCVLWYGSPMSVELLGPMLDDKRALSGFAIPLRVCDRAAQAIKNGCKELSFDEEWGVAEKDRAIEAIKQYCKKAAAAAEEAPKKASK